MATFPKITFTQLCVNRRLVTLNSEGGINSCEVYHHEGRRYLALSITENVTLDLDVEKSLVEFNYSSWAPGPEAVTILDFGISLRSIPEWMSIYSSAKAGCVHRIVATLKVEDSKSNYENFTRVLRSIISKMQWNSLEKEKAIDFWNERCAALPNQTVKCISFKGRDFSNFSLADLNRLKFDKHWLSDAHVLFYLRYSHFHQDCGERNIWGGRKIILLDTTFWTTMSKDPNRYKDDKYRNKNNLFDCDFAVIPIFRGDNHWLLGIVEKPAEFMDGNTVFHILDSLRDGSPEDKEGKKLQTLLLNHIEGATFMDGRIATNVAQVPLQLNSKDCGCFAIYFAKKFFLNIDSTLALVNTSFSSAKDGLAAWGLKNANVTFVRREIRTLLFTYIHRGDAEIEYV